MPCHCHRNYLKLLIFALSKDPQKDAHPLSPSHPQVPSHHSQHHPIIVLIFFACIREVSQVLFLYKQVGTEGGMYKAIYKQFIKKVILVQDLL